MKIFMFLIGLFFSSVIHAEDGTDQLSSHDQYIQSLREQSQKYHDELDKIEADQKKREADEKTRRAAAKIRYAAKQKADQIRYKSESQQTLTKLDVGTLCTLYGRALRKEKIDYFALDFDGSAPQIIDEAKKRKLNFKDADVVKKTLNIGSTQCQMYAALGQPESENRTVTSSRISIQHVYRTGFYVYTDNGIVTSWQD